MVGILNGRIKHMTSGTEIHSSTVERIVSRKSIEISQPHEGPNFIRSFDFP